jgi:hypothetical protein
MSLYKKIELFEIEVISFYKQFILNLQPIIELSENKLESLKESLKNSNEKILVPKFAIAEFGKKIELLKEYRNEIHYYITEFQKNMSILKKDITLNNIELVNSNINRLRYIIISVMDCFNEYFFKNNSTITLLEAIEKFKVKQTTLNLTFFEQSNKKRIEYMQIIEASKTHSKIGFIEKLGFSHIQKIEVWKELNHNKIQIRFTNKYDFDRGVPSIKQKIINKCNELIKTRPDYEKRCLQLKNMSSRELEKEVLEIFKNTFINILDDKKELIRDSIRRIHVELTHLEESIAEYNPKSNFVEMYIQTRLNTDLIGALIRNENILLEGDAYKDIVHEITHSYDKGVNTTLEEDAQYEKTLTKISNKITDRGKLLAKTLIDLRKEAIATFSESTIDKTFSKPYNIIEMKLNLSNKNFEKVISQKNIMLSNIDKIYDDGSTHQVSEMMAKLIFLHDTQGKFLYQLKEGYFKKIDDRAEKTLTEQLIKKIKEGYACCIAATPEIMEYEINNFINKLSIMPPERFLEKYETACNDLKIEPIISKKDF